MNRDEHIAWARERADEYLKRDQTAGAFASFISDLGKHPNIDLPRDNFWYWEGLSRALAGDAAGLRDWLQRFD